MLLSLSAANYMLCVQKKNRLSERNLMLIVHHVNELYHQVNLEQVF